MIVKSVSDSNIIDFSIVGPSKNLHLYTASLVF